jgi:hypothetical protein
MAIHINTAPDGFWVTDVSMSDTPGKFDLGDCIPVVAFLINDENPDLEPVAITWCGKEPRKFPHRHDAADFDYNGRCEHAKQDVEWEEIHWELAQRKAATQ